MFKKIQELETHHQVIFALMIAFALVSFWRGMWGLLDIYLLPESPTLSLWVSVVIGVVVLIMTNYFAKMVE